jgi:hypothetical protein
MDDLRKIVSFWIDIGSAAFCTLLVQASVAGAATGDARRLYALNGLWVRDFLFTSTLMFKCYYLCASGVGKFVGNSVLYLRSGILISPRWYRY